MSIIETSRLQLIPVERRHVESLLRSKEELGEMLQVTIPSGWPQFPQAFTQHQVSREIIDPLMPRWNGYFFIDARRDVLVGNGGFKGPPDSDGMVELGYEVVPAEWNCGFATEAVGALIAWAFTQANVNLVSAHTLPASSASTSVLSKAGMEFVSEIGQQTAGKLWKWAIRREGNIP